MAADLHAHAAQLEGRAVLVLEVRDLARIPGVGVRQAELEAPLQVGLPVAVDRFEPEALAAVAGAHREDLVDPRRDRLGNLLGDALVHVVVTGGRDRGKRLGRRRAREVFLADRVLGGQAVVLLLRDRAVLEQEVEKARVLVRGQRRCRQQENERGESRACERALTSHRESPPMHPFVVGHAQSSTGRLARPEHHAGVCHFRYARVKL